MSSISKKAGLLSFCAVLLIGALAYAARTYQKHRVQKIDFILWDREYNNTARLTNPDLIRYLEACGADAVKSDDRLHVSYQGVFISKEWFVTLQEK
jgi:hypothetical protein